MYTVSIKQNHSSKAVRNKVSVFSSTRLWSKFLQHNMNVQFVSYVYTYQPYYWCKQNMKLQNITGVHFADFFSSVPAEALCDGRNPARFLQVQAKYLGQIQQTELAFLKKPMISFNKQITRQRNMFWSSVRQERRYLYELVDSVEIIVGSCSLLGNQALLKVGEAAVHIVLQTRLQVRGETHSDYSNPVKNNRERCAVTSFTSGPGRLWHEP